MGVALHVAALLQVEGIVGTFIANVKDPSGRFGSTVISYDKGGNWVSLRPPTVDRNDVFLNCQQVSLCKPLPTISRCLFVLGFVVCLFSRLVPCT